MLRGILLNLGVVWLPAITVVFAAILWLRHRVAGTDARWVLPWLDPLRLGGILLIAFALASIVYSLRSATRSGRVEGRGIPYLARRRFESRTPWLFRPAIVLLVLGSMSPLVALLDTHSWFGNGGLVGGAMTFFGALGGLWSRFVPKGASAARVPAWTGPAGAALVLYGMALLGFWLATQLVPATAAPRPSSVAILLVLPILALAVALCVDLNYTTLHRYYRDRLMEAFLPDFGHGGVPVRPEATAADKARLHEMCDPDAPAAPYHLLNTHVVLTSLDERAGTDAAARERLRLRGGDSFLLSPRSCGSRVTGWCDTSRFMSGSLTLATAMAISGAAVNPNAAAAGVGPQRSTSFAVLMSLLNIRLGFWAPNPRGRRRDPIPNHVHPGLTGCIDRLTPDSDFLELTDGGNFENVGVYELLRRNVRTILVCDAGADPDYAFADLQNLLSRAEADFNVAIAFVPQPPLGALMPSPAAAGAYPHGLSLSSQPFVEATITYANRETGRLFYLKAAIFSALRLHVLGFKGANPGFPDDPTTDQFFSESRFEAYRELGFASVEQMVANSSIGDALARM